jgi:maleylpyruvate isomerase
MSVASGPGRLPAELPHGAETAVATSRYLEALTVLHDDEMRAGSLLPGWSRGHVVTHVARNADGLRNLLVWARTGVETPQYPSAEQRNGDIDSGSGRTADELLADARESADRFAEEAARLSGDDWAAEVRMFSGPEPMPARNVLKARRIEVEVHHADLGIGYTAADWPEGFTRMLVDRVQDDRAEGPSMVLSSTDVEGLWKLGPGPGPEVKGTLADLAWWLVGRGDGSGLVSSTGELPRLGKWR